MAGIPGAGACQKWVVMLPVLDPIKHTRSAWFTTRLAALRE